MDTYYNRKYNQGQHGTTGDMKKTSGTGSANVNVPPTQRMTQTKYINTVSFSGNLGKDPVIVYLEDGKYYVKSSLAVWLPNSDGVNHTQWFELILWKRDDVTYEDDMLAKMLLAAKKGNPVAVSGRLQKRGRDILEIKIEGLRMLPDRR